MVPSMTPEQLRAEYERRIAALDSMMQSEGWQLLRAALEGSERAIFEKMQKDPSSETARHFGAYNTVIDIKNWPMRERQVMVHMLRTMGTGSTQPKR